MSNLDQSSQNFPEIYCAAAIGHYNLPWMASAIVAVTAAAEVASREDASPGYDIGAQIIARTAVRSFGEELASLGVDEIQIGFQHDMATCFNLPR